MLSKFRASSGDYFIGNRTVNCIYFLLGKKTILPDTSFNDRNIRHEPTNLPLLEHQ